MEYSPSDNEVSVERRAFWHDRLGVSFTGSLHQVIDEVWFPNPRQFGWGRDKAAYCYLLGNHLLWHTEALCIPYYVTESRHWLATAERLIRDYDGRLRSRVVGLMGIDPEKLSQEAQALVVEAALKYA